MRGWSCERRTTGGDDKTSGSASSVPPCLQQVGFFAANCTATCQDLTGLIPAEGGASAQATSTEIVPESQSRDPSALVWVLDCFFFSQPWFNTQKIRSLTDQQNSLQALKKEFFYLFIFLKAHRSEPGRTLTFFVFTAFKSVSSPATASSPLRPLHNSRVASAADRIIKHSGVGKQTCCLALMVSDRSLKPLRRAARRAPARRSLDLSPEADWKTSRTSRLSGWILEFLTATLYF